VSVKIFNISNKKIQYILKLKIDMIDFRMISEGSCDSVTKERERERD